MQRSRRSVISALAASARLIVASAANVMLMVNVRSLKISNIDGFIPIPIERRRPRMASVTAFPEADGSTGATLPAVCASAVRNIRIEAVEKRQLAYKAIDAARREARIVPFTTQLPDPAVRQFLRREWMPYLEEAFRVLQIARELDAADSSAAAYLGLVARANAMIAESPAEAQALIR